MVMAAMVMVMIAVIVVAMSVVAMSVVAMVVMAVIVVMIGMGMVRMGMGSMGMGSMGMGMGMGSMRHVILARRKWVIELYSNHLAFGDNLEQGHDVAEPRASLCQGRVLSVTAWGALEADQAVGGHDQFEIERIRFSNQIEFGFAVHVRSLCDRSSRTTQCHRHKHQATEGSSEHDSTARRAEG